MLHANYSQFRVQRLGLRVWGPGFRGSGLGFRCKPF